VVGFAGFAVIDTAGFGDVVGGLGGLGAATSQTVEICAFPPGPLASTTNVCVPFGRPLYVLGLAHAVAWPSSEQVADDVLVADQANVALEDVDGLSGCVVSSSDGGADVPGTTFHSVETVAVPHLLLTFTTKVCEPTASRLYLIGLEHSDGGAPSSEHATCSADRAFQVKAASDHVVVEDGYDVSVTDGVLPTAAPVLVCQIVSVTSTSAADANTSKLRVCVMAVCGGSG
jgi:hypothetical protein